MQSTATSSTKSPIGAVPYDVLSEIFTYCLPQYPLKEQQPNTAIAPMLLCHICSSWRTIALASPTLWSHLSFCLTHFANGRGHGMPLAFAESEIEFIRWWKTNQGLIAPVLSFSVKYNGRKISQQPEEDMVEIMGFLVEYLMSAQYLRLDRFFWVRIRERCILVKYGTLPGSRYEVEALTSPENFHALRRLSISNGVMRLKHSSHIPLTHISLHTISFPLSIWFSLIRALSNLECGYFNIIDVRDLNGYTEPSPCILPRLSLLCVIFRSANQVSPKFTFSMLFTNLHLPSVRTLALSWDLDTIAGLYTALKCAPAVTTLVLGAPFLDLAGANSSQAGLTARGHIEPIWHHVPHLLELQLEMPQAHSREQFERTKLEMEAKLDIFIRDTLFSEGSWLDLQNPACPIRVVTIVNNTPLPAEHLIIDWAPGSEFESLGEFTMEKIRGHTDSAPNVVFQLALKSATYHAVDALGD